MGVVYTQKRYSVRCHGYPKKAYFCKGCSGGGSPPPPHPVLAKFINFTKKSNRILNLVKILKIHQIFYIAFRTLASFIKIKYENWKLDRDLGFWCDAPEIFKRFSKSKGKNLLHYHSFPYPEICRVKIKFVGSNGSLFCKRFGAGGHPSPEKNWKISCNISKSKIKDLKSY